MKSITAMTTFILRISHYSRNCMTDLLHDTDDHVTFYAYHMDPFSVLFCFCYGLMPSFLRCAMNFLVSYFLVTYSSSHRLTTGNREKNKKRRWPHSCKGWENGLFDFNGSCVCMFVDDEFLFGFFSCVSSFFFSSANIQTSCFLSLYSLRKWVKWNTSKIVFSSFFVQETLHY